MSAYIVDNYHMDVLVSYFADRRHGEGLWTKIDGQYTYMTPENAYKVAEILYKENLKSVNYRYDESTPFSYEFTYMPDARDLFTVTDIAGGLDCLEYQSCEHEDYHQSQAWATLCDMRKDLLRKLQNQLPDDEQVWSITERKVKVN